MITTDDPVLDLTAAGEILTRIREENKADIKEDDLIPILQEIQDSYGYLPHPVLTWVSKETKIPESRMFGVITFYEQFHLKPRGKHIIRCCRGTACHVKGGYKIAENLQDLLGVKEGGTTEDGQFTFETVACLGTCFLAPVIMIDDDYFGELTSDRLEKILKKYE